MEQSPRLFSTHSKTCPSDPTQKCLPILSVPVHPAFLFKFMQLFRSVCVNPHNFPVPFVPVRKTFQFWLSKLMLSSRSFSLNQLQLFNSSIVIHPAFHFTSHNPHNFPILCLQIHATFQFCLSQAIRHDLPLKV